MKLSLEERGVETFNVSESTSPLKSNKSNSEKSENSKLSRENGNTNGEMYDAQSQNTESPNYEDFVDFDPSNFRLTPQSTISPKREEGVLTDFKSVESISSLHLLSVEYSENEEEPFYNEEDQEVMVDKEKGENLEVMVEDLNKENERNESVDVEMTTDDERKEVMEMENSSLEEKELESLNDNFEVSIPPLKNREDVKVDVELDQIEKEKETKPLDTGRLFNYLKSEKVNEVCKRLKADLKGTKKYKFEELPLTDEIPFSERVYNYVEDLKAYSTVSSQDPTTSSRLSSLDLKTLLSAETVETVDTEEIEKDFEKALESSINQLEQSNELDNLYKTLETEKESEFEMNVEENKEVEEIYVEDKSESTREEYVEQKEEKEQEFIKMNEDVNFEINLEKKLVTLEGESTREEYVELKEQKEEEFMEIDEYVSEDKEEYMRKEVKEEFLKRFKNMEKITSEEEKMRKEIEVEEQKGEVNIEAEWERDKWYGLECMSSSLGVKLVNTCLKSVKIEVGENLHKYDVYKGTKMMLNKFLEIMTKINQLEKKLKQNIMDLEKNNKGIEATRNSYVSLGKTTNRLEGLLNYYKEYEKLQKESIKLKTENIALMRTQILETLNKFQEASNASETVEKMLTLENNLVEKYNKTGFFIVPLNHECKHNFMYLINYNYHYNLKGTSSNILLKDYVSNDNWPTKEIVEKLKVVELLPYKPHMMKPDMELKMFLYFQSEPSSSSSCGSSNYYTSPKVPSSNSNLPSLDVFQPKINQKTTKVKEYKKIEGESLMEVNLEVDLNMYLEPYSLKNELNIVLYAPLHTDSPYYKFKYDLIQNFNVLIYERIKNYSQDLTENIQLFELLETVVQLGSELNVKFQYYLNQFQELLNLSSNHYYVKIKTSPDTFGDQSAYGGTGFFNVNNGLKGNITENNNGSSNVNNVEFNPYSEVNPGYMIMNDLNKVTKDSGKERMLKLMLTFKNNVPCLWCNVYFNFDHKNNKTKFLSHFYKDYNDGIVNKIQFEFVHKLNKSYLIKFQGKLAELNETVNGPKKGTNLVDHITSTLTSHQFYM